MRIRSLGNIVRGKLATVLAARWLHRRRTVSRLAACHDERLKERKRIAQELHDTLLQDIEALVLNLRVVDSRYGDSNPARADLRTINEAADKALRDARLRVGGLRTEGQNVDDLGETFRELAERLAVLYPVHFCIHKIGSDAELQPRAAEEAAAIGREAILNAFRHAKATVIDISIKYGANYLELSVRDNGIGLDQEVLKAGQRQGHWGLVGMAERARMLRATFGLVNVRDGGTLVRLRIPSSLAFVQRREPRTMRFHRLASNM